MRNFLLIAAFFALMLSVQGCDFFRMIIGRPTSEDIAHKKVIIDRIEREALEAESLRDTLEAFTEEADDSESALDICEMIRSEGIKLSGSSLISHEVRDRIPGRYVIIIGAFGSYSNAEAQAARARNLSYETVLIPYTNGLVAVGVSPCDDLSRTYGNLQQLRQEAFCPSDSWILDKIMAQ